MSAGFIIVFVKESCCGRQVRMRSTSPRIRGPYVGRRGVQIRRLPAFTSSQAAISLVAFCGGPLTVLTGLEAKQVFCRVGELTPLGRYARPAHARPSPPPPRPFRQQLGFRRWKVAGRDWRRCCFQHFTGADRDCQRSSLALKNNKKEQIKKTRYVVLEANGALRSTS